MSEQNKNALENDTINSAQNTNSHNTISNSKPTLTQAASSQISSAQSKPMPTAQENPQSPEPQSESIKSSAETDKPDYIIALERKIRRERILLNNPVIMQGLGLSVLLVACRSGQSALVLSVAAFLLLMPTRFLSSILCLRMPARFRGVMYALSSGIVFIGVYYIIRLLFSSANIVQVGLYLPLLVMDPIILKRYENVIPEPPIKAIKKGLTTSAGFVLVLMCTGILREFLGTGTFFTIPVIANAPLPIAALPVGGFIVLAILMAVWRSIATIIKRYLHEGQFVANEKF